MAAPLAIGGHVPTRGEYVVGVAAAKDELPLATEELRLVAERMKMRLKMLDVKGKAPALSQPLVLADVLHFALYGRPLSHLTDPTFASLAGLPLSWWQQMLPASHHTLAFLNACDAGVPSNRNFYQTFETDESVTYQSLLLLNRKSAVIAPLWRTFDVVAYVFSSIFYEFVGGGLDVTEAYTRTVVRMYDITREEVVGILQQIADETVRRDKVARFANSQEEFPLRHPYCYGVYQLFGLL